MSQTPDANPLGPIDRETFNALRRDPEKLEAHLDGVLAAVHERMMAPFQQTRPLSYQKFPKAAPVDIGKLVSMPGVQKKSESAKTTAQSAPVFSAASIASAPEKAHPPTPKPEKKPPFPTVSQGTLIHQSDVAPRRGIVQNDLPDIPQRSPLHAENSKPDPVPKIKASPSIGQAADPPLAQELNVPQKTDPDAVKKRFEERQSGISSLLKDKGNLT